MYRLAIEARYKRCKLSIETRHYEVLFGITIVLGEIDRNGLVKILGAVSRELLDKAVKLLGQGYEIIRIYIPRDYALAIIRLFNADSGMIIPDEYEYVLVIEKSRDRV